MSFVPHTKWENKTSGAVTKTKEIPCLTGKGMPTTSTIGAVGCLYMDTDSGAVYKCTAASDGGYTWVDALDSAEMKRVIEAYLEANPPADGEDGGHYTPIVTQPTADTMKVEFAPSKAGMAAVEPVTVKLPSGGSDSEQNYTLPVASETVLGGVKLPPKTDAHTELATVDENGNVWVKPPSTSVTEVGGVEFINHVGNLYSADNVRKEIKLGANVFELDAGTHSLFFRATPNTSYVITRSNVMQNMGSFGQADMRGICTQAPGSTDAPVDLTKWSGGSGGLGGYIIVTTNANFSADSEYLVWAVPGGVADGAEYIIYEGDSIDGYDSVGGYSADNGRSTSDELLVHENNLDRNILTAMDKANTALQADDLKYDKLSYTQHNVAPRTTAAAGNTALGDLRWLMNSAVISQEIIRHRLQLGSYYAHCPSVNVVDDTAYISAFENTESTVDSYVLEGTNTHLYVVDIATMTQTAEYIVAQHGDTVEGLTFAYGSGACQSVLIDETTLRTVFVAKLQDAEGVDEWYQCYRDFDITTETFGDIGLCKLVDTDGGTHDFNTANASLYIQELADTSVNTNIVCQPAKVDDTWYVACGCQAQWPNMPILTTTDWITFSYWATPSVEGNSAHYEMAITTDGTYLYTATRQTSKDTVQLMRVNIANQALSGNVKIPTGDGSRSCLIKSGNLLYVFHVATSQRLNSGQVSVVSANAMHQGASEAVTTPPMVYPSVVPCDDGYFAAYMVPYGLECSKFSAVEKYDWVKATGIAAKLIELVTGG